MELLRRIVKAFKDSWIFVFVYLAIWVGLIVLVCFKSYGDTSSEADTIDEDEFQMIAKL